MPAIIYVRRSQAADSQGSLVTQQADCVSWAEAHDMTIAGVFVDDDQSAFKPSRRAGLGAALAALRNDEADTLISWRLDRLSRRGAGEVGRLLDEFDNKRIVFTQQGLDSDQPGTRLVIMLLAEIARSESETLGQRVARAKQADVESRRWPGGLPPLGYLINAERRLELDSGASPALRTVITAVINGASIREAVELLNSSELRPKRSETWGKSSVARLLRSPALCGWMPDATNDAGKRRAIGAIKRDSEGQPIKIVAGESLISVSEYRQLQATLDKRSEGSRPIRPASALLTGFLKCGECGLAMHIDRGAGLYRCSRRGKLGCKGKGIGIQRAETVTGLAAMLRLSGLDPDSDALNAVALVWVGQRSPELPAARKAQELERTDLAARLEELAEARFSAASISAEQYKRLTAKLKQRLDALEAVEPPSIDVGPLLDLAMSAEEPTASPIGKGSIWYDAELETKRLVLSALIEKVTNRSELEITWL